MLRGESAHPPTKPCEAIKQAPVMHRDSPLRRIWYSSEVRPPGRGVRVLVRKGGAPGSNENVASTRISVEGKA
jgi:hypothetical protein